MYNALTELYPEVHPPVEFLRNMFSAFQDHGGCRTSDNQLTWGKQFAKWLPNNVGLIRDPADINWISFRVVDEKLYTIAILRYT